MSNLDLGELRKNFFFFKSLFKRHIFIWDVDGGCDFDDYFEGDCDEDDDSNI